MMTIEQKQKINTFLSSKNLPLDLKEEILDHIREQIGDKITHEHKTFELALEETILSWKADLKMSRIFWWKPSITKIHREIVNKTTWKIFAKSLFYFTFYFILSLGFVFYNKSVASFFVFTTYGLAVAIFFGYLFFNFKMIKSISGNRKQKNISYLQKGSQIFYLSTMFIITMILINFESRFDKYYSFLQHLTDFSYYNQVGISSFVIFNIYAFGWIYGYLYYIDYRKTLKHLEQKINFKL